MATKAQPVQLVLAYTCWGCLMLGVILLVVALVVLGEKLAVTGLGLILFGLALAYILGGLLRRE